MKRHTINKEDLKVFVKEIELAGSYGKDENKTLVAHINFNNKKIDFKVINYGKIVTTEQDLNTAIDAYNEI